MEKNRNVKIIAIIALFIGILGLTLGFASFSSLLKISSKAVVSPDDSSFKVELSSSENEVVVGNVSAKVGNGSVATIVNGTSPTISGLVANFTRPGESVSYEFYAINTGDLDAILNKVDFTTISGTDKKICVPTGTGSNVADPTMLANACNDIRVTITVASEERACDTSTYGNHPLNIGESEKVIVVIEYATEGTRVDGPFRVNFGDIRLNYSTIQDGTKNISTCEDTIIACSLENPTPLLNKRNVLDNDCNGEVSLGDLVTLGTERFYVISTNTTTNEVRLLTEYKINPTTGEQDSTCTGTNCGIKFANSPYWGNTSGFPFVYNSNASIYTSIQAYRNKLVSLGYTNVTANLVRYEDANRIFGCNGSANSCISKYAWFYNVGYYWTGSAMNSSDILVMNSRNVGVDHYSPTSNIVGLRPVITISYDDI